MIRRNTVDYWGLPSKLFHWVMAVLVIGMLGMGVYISNFVDDIYRAFDLTQIHKSFGFVAFCLVALRLAWRWNSVFAQCTTWAESCCSRWCWCI